MRNTPLHPLRGLVIFLSFISLLFLSLPIVALIIRLIETQGWANLPESGISEAIFLSAVTTTVSACLTLIFGTPLAYVLARYPIRFKRFIHVLVELPIVLPPAVAGLGLLVAFGRRGLLGGILDGLNISIAFTTMAVILAQTFVSAPFYIRSAQVGFSSIPLEIEDAGRVDGANSWQVFRYITMPLAQPILLAGLILSWARALGEFGATILFAGNVEETTQTMSLLVYDIWARNLDAAVWVGVILVVMALIALLIARTLTFADESLDI